ncbi:unnamed protein product [Brugia pahangi]|uniref:LTD domain-containing protein n=1 Tax=Brugia pahangi TaxID=6280 RepID=A0A0N4T1A8_BRUPA|nr:unnamed protein product [Brugia pahangi]
MEIKKGRDREVRNASIGLPHGRLLNSSVNTLYILEVDDEENSTIQLINLGNQSARRICRSTN